MSGSAQRREIIRAVNGERARCVKLMENARAQLGGANASLTGRERNWAWEVLTDYLDRIKRPYRVRVAAKRRKMCGLCGDEGHGAPKCPRADVLGASA